jgi:hypothetical protein
MYPKNPSANEIPSKIKPDIHKTDAEFRAVIIELCEIQDEQNPILALFLRCFISKTQLLINKIRMGS